MVHTMDVCLVSNSQIGCNTLRLELKHCKITEDDTAISNSHTLKLCLLNANCIFSRIVIWSIVTCAKPDALHPYSVNIC